MGGGLAVTAFSSRVVRLITLTFLGTFAAVILLIAAMYLEHFLGTELPMPSGSYRVGRASYFFSSDAAARALAKEPEHELAVWIWYPAASADTSKAADYLPAPWLRAAQQSWSWIMTQVFTRDLSKVRVHSVSDAPMSSAKRAYPIAVMRTGSSALTLQYTILAEDLASHGFVVVGFDAPYRTQLVVLPNGEVKYRLPQNDPEEVPLAQVNRVLMMWTQDVSFVLDRLEVLNDRDDRGLLTHRLDLTRIGVFGHSFGGAQALQLCHDDPRCKAGIDIDGIAFGSVVTDGVKQPFMFLLSDHSHDLGSETEGRQVAHDFHVIYEHLPATDRVALMIEGADHYSFSDGGVTRSHVMLSFLRGFGLVIDGKSQLATTSACVSGFFDKYLNGKAEGLARCTQLQGVKPAKLVIDGQ
jgi:predicted dienelactone hydrolase